MAAEPDPGIPGVLVLAVVNVGLTAKLGRRQEASRWQDASSRLRELSNRGPRERVMPG